MFQYAFKWFSDLNDKNYYLASEQLYQSNDKSSIYMIEYGQSNIIHHSDMPYTKLNAYCQKYNYHLEDGYRENDEIKVLYDILSVLKIDDIEVSWDDANQQIIAADEDNFWNGKQFYDFLIEEVIVYEDGKPVNVQDKDYQKLFDYSSIQKEIKDIKANQPKINYHISDENIGVGTPKQRYQNNIVAIQLLFSLEKQNRHATKEEQDILAKYVGWGGLSEVFVKQSHHGLMSMQN